MIKAAGLGLFTFNIVGFPFESRKEMKETFKLNKEIMPSDGGVCTFFYPYKGTELYKICKQKQLLKNVDEMMEITNYNTRPSIKMTVKQEKDCIYYKKIITRYFYRQCYQTEITHLFSEMPSGMKKYFLSVCYFMYYQVRTILLINPLLYRTVKHLYRLLGVRVLMMHLTKHKLR